MIVTISALILSVSILTFAAWMYNSQESQFRKDFSFGLLVVDILGVIFYFIVYSTMLPQDTPSNTLTPDNYTEELKDYEELLDSVVQLNYLIDQDVDIDISDGSAAIRTYGFSGKEIIYYDLKLCLMSNKDSVKEARHNLAKRKLDEYFEEKWLELMR